MILKNSPSKKIPGQNTQNGQIQDKIKIQDISRISRTSGHPEVSEYFF